MAAMVLTQGYNRSRVKPYTASDHCLYWTEDTVITWKANALGNPATPGETEFDAMRASFTTWSDALSCSSLRLQEGPRTASRDIGWLSAAADKDKNENILVFRTKLCSEAAPVTDSCWDDADDSDDCGNKFDCWIHPASAIALATTTYDPRSGGILDADIEFNASTQPSPQQTFLFTTVDTPCVPPGSWSTSCTSWDIQNTLTHEIGHALGLDHVASPASTMYLSAPPGETSKRTLDLGTRQYPCDAYPVGAVAKDCVIRPPSSVGSAPYNAKLGDLYRGCGCGSGASLLLLPLAALLVRRRR